MEKIKITRTLLEKNENELTPEELSAVKSYKQTQKIYAERLDKANENIRKNCKILCSSYEKYPIPAYGWIQNAEDLYYKLESMNYKYKKYGLSVVLDQAKEKYATFRVYTSINVDEIGLIGFLSKPFRWLSKKLENVNYGIRYVEDKPAYVSCGWSELTKDEYENRMNSFGVKFQNTKEITSKYGVDIEKIKDITYLYTENEKYYRSYPIYHSPKTHPVFTKHRFLHMIFMLSNRISWFFAKIYKEPLVQTVMKEAFDREVDRLISKNEKNCENVCQDCGTNFYEHNEKCETVGWYNYVCERCAMARGTEYIKFGSKDHMIFKEGIERPDLVKNNGEPKNG